LKAGGGVAVAAAALLPAGAGAVNSFEAAAVLATGAFVGLAFSPHFQFQQPFVRRNRTLAPQKIGLNPQNHFTKPLTITNTLSPVWIRRLGHCLAVALRRRLWFVRLGFTLGFLLGLRLRLHFGLRLG